MCFLRQGLPNWMLTAYLQEAFSIYMGVYTWGEGTLIKRTPSNESACSILCIKLKVGVSFHEGQGELSFQERNYMLSYFESKEHKTDTTTKKLRKSLQKELNTCLYRVEIWWQRRWKMADS